LDGDDEYDPGDTGLDERQSDRPAGTQRPGGEDHLVLPEPRHEQARQA
jgi:hypothetical protein